MPNDQDLLAWLMGLGVLLCLLVLVLVMPACGPTAAELDGGADAGAELCEPSTNARCEGAGGQWDRAHECCIFMR